MPSNNRPQDAGKLKIFLGFAPGVGKSYAMVDEALRRRRRGQDVVIGALNARGRSDTSDIAADIEVIPTIEGDLDLPAIIRRRPEVVLIDDLHASNRAGAERAKRWQDVEAILDSGISVLGTINVQHLESLNDHIREITGITEEETVPDRVLHEAEEIELVDLTPRALINRLERGDVFPADQIDEKVRAYFREGNLGALRELAMREAAQHVDEDVVEYRRDKHIEKPWATTDRLMICVSPTRTSLRLIRRGWRIAQRLHGEAVAVHVEESPPGPKERKILQNDFALAERLGIRTVMLKGDVSETLIAYAKQHNVTQIIVGHPDRSRFQEMLKGSIINELIKALKTVDIMVIATDDSAAEAALG